MSNVLSGACWLAAVMLSLGVCMLGHASADQGNAWRGLGMEIPWASAGFFMFPLSLGIASVLPFKQLSPPALMMP